jgi:hypothetical protein
MNRFQPFLFLLILFAFNAAYGQTFTLSELNGEYWKSLSTSAVSWCNSIHTPSGAPTNFADNIPKNLAINYKSIFIGGMLEMGLAIDLPAELFVRSTDKSGKAQYLPYGNPIPVGRNVSVEQYVKGLDDFYSDYKNTNVRIFDALNIVNYKVGGVASDELIEWWTRYFRASPENRNILWDSYPSPKK